MAASFAAITPIFLLILAGNGLRRLPQFELGFWRGLERMGFYVLYPVLLFVTVVRADFSALSLEAVIIVLGVGWTLLGLAALAMWPLLRRLDVSRATFSSVFQAAIRWNGFIALAVAESLFGTVGAAMVALVMAIMIIPINATTVAVVAWFTASTPNVLATIGKVAVNPLIIATATALIVRTLPMPLPEPIMDALNLVGRAALGMGLLAIGAGLQLGRINLIDPSLITATLLKMAAMPALVLALALLAGIDGQQLQYLALCAAVPTAMNGYVLAREMGADADGYAIIVTVQTAIAFVSIPAWLWIAAQLVAG